MVGRPSEGLLGLGRMRHGGKLQRLVVSLLYFLGVHSGFGNETNLYGSFV